MSKTNKKQALGRGLSALLQDSKNDIKSASDKNADQVIGNIIDLELNQGRFRIDGGNRSQDAAVGWQRGTEAGGRCGTTLGYGGSAGRLHGCRLDAHRATGQSHDLRWQA